MGSVWQTSAAQKVLVSFPDLENYNFLLLSDCWVDFYCLHIS